MREAVVELWPADHKPTMEQVSDPEWLQNHSREQAPAAALVDVFECHIEKQLVEPTIIYDFPVEVSPLSKNKPMDPAFVERFELYAAGMKSRMPSPS
jgi:lysyl-tRNA synthetase class 2